MHHMSSVARDASADIVILVVILVALIVPLIPTFLDHTARMQVHFRISGMARPDAFTVETPKRVCAIMAEALSFQDAGTGEYTDVACSE